MLNKENMNTFHMPALNTTNINKSLKFIKIYIKKSWNLDKNC